MTAQFASTTRHPSTPAPSRRSPRRGCSAGHYPLRTALLCFLESRPRVAVIFQLRFLAAVLLRHPTAFSAIALLRVLGLAAGWGLCVLFVYLFNGVSDVVGDRANGSQRPIARGDLNPVTACRVAWGAGILGVVGCFLDGPLLGMLALLHVAVGYAYSGAPCYLKRKHASASIAITVLGLTTYAAGCQALPSSSAAGGAALIALTMSLWMGLVGATTKDFGDVAGDVLAGRRNCVAQSGIRTQQVRVCVAAVGLAAGFWLAAQWADPALLPAAATLGLGSGLLAAACLRTSRRLRNDASRSTAKLPYRVFMWLQYAVHAVVITSAGLAILNR